MTANLRIFVSSTCADLFQERRDVCKALLDLGHSVILSELPGTIPVNPRLSCIESCLNAIEGHSDLLCLVISGNYGSTDSAGRSITTKEYLKAKGLGIPTLTFVRQKIWDLLPLFRKNPLGDFSPAAADNRVFELIEQIRGLDGDNWIFTFTEASDIVATIRYQLSCLLRATLEGPGSEPTGTYYRYVNNYSVRINEEGWCHRSLEYHVINRSDAPLGRILMGDTSDLPLSKDDLDLQAYDSLGRSLEAQFLIDTDKYKRWELVLENPLLPGREMRCYVSYRSSDRQQMQTGHTFYAHHGFIRYLFPPGMVGEVTDASVRDTTGWHPVLGSLAIHRVAGATAVFYPYNKVGGGFQFRLRWTELPETDRNARGGSRNPALESDAPKSGAPLSLSR